MRLHSWLSPKCHVGESSLAGIGVFASRPLAEGELVAVWGGVIYTARKSMAWRTYPPLQDTPI